jgi:hypothetical protein
LIWAKGYGWADEKDDADGTELAYEGQSCEQALSFQKKLSHNCTHLLTFNKIHT